MTRRSRRRLHTILEAVKGSPRRSAVVKTHKRWLCRTFEAAGTSLQASGRVPKALQPA